jgi:L-methionine (R)-S-oxide reductase
MQSIGRIRKQFSQPICYNPNIFSTQDATRPMKPASIPGFSSKQQFYETLAKELHSLLEGEDDRIANAANTTALLSYAMSDINWVGFYFLRGGQLVVGPFQGKPACTRLEFGKGVCGTAAVQRRTIVVPDVHQFPGHIACDAASVSEIVIPMVAEGRLIGVLDVDSPISGRFDEEDGAGLELIVAVFIAAVGEKLPAPDSSSD